MRNRLPEKLTLLRKHFGYSQGDLAKSVGVQVAEYLNWENGKSLPRIFQTKIMADIFHVTLDSLIDNKQEVELVNLEEIGESVSIPFISGASRNSEDESVSIMPVEGVIDNSLNKHNENVSMDASTAELTQKEEIVRGETEVISEVEEPVTTTNDDKKKKTSIMILGAVGLLALLLLGAIFFLNRGGSDTRVPISHSNRLAEGNNYTIFIRETGKPQFWGDFPYEDILSGNEFVQVDAYDTNLIGLKSDGTIITNGNYSVSSSWDNIVSIASGRNHIVALEKSGKVHCTGSSAACEVDEWTDIKEVFAGNAITAGITNENRLRIVGEEVASLDGMKDVKSLDIGATKIAIVKTDGSVEAYNISGLSTIDTSSLKNIELVSVGSDFVAGVSRDGNVLVETGDESKKEAAAKMSNITFIASDEDTFVAIDKSGNITGFGENKYSQYGKGGSETPKPSADTEKLDKVQNITFDQTTSNVQVKWDAVKNANSYEISFSPSLSRTIPRSAGTSVSIPTSDFVKDQEYTVTIVAYASDDEKYEQSEPATATFKYVPKTIQLNSPANIQALTGPNTWNIVWEPVEHADYYLVSVDGGEEVKVEKDPIYEYANIQGFTGNSEHTIVIKAGSNDEKYTESEPAQKTLIYETPRFEVELNYVDVATGVAVNDGASTPRLTVSQKTYTIGELLTGAILPVGYELAFPDNTVDIDKAKMIDVSVKAKAVPTPEPTPTPEGTPEEGGGGE